MALPVRTGPRPDIGDILWVVHDFVARTSDELTLKKGDFVELLERDDEFGDRWYLGRHLSNNYTGLFPEAYTQPAPKDQLRALNNGNKPMTPLLEDQNVSGVHLDRLTLNGANSTEVSPTHTGAATPLSNPLSNAGHMSIPEIINPSQVGGATTIGIPSLSSPLPTDGHQTLVDQGDSQVLNDTLNVIDEHITHLRSPPSTSALHASNDSGSEYSTNFDHRMSYIHGEETDEEEGDVAHSRQEVIRWGPDDVAEYLFTVGVEKHHCEVFRDQEITGEVLLEMDQSSLFIKAFDLGSVGRRLKTWSKIKSLQDEVASAQAPRRTTVGSAAHFIDSPSAGGGSSAATRSRTNTVTSGGRPDIITDTRPSSIHSKHASSAMTPTRLGSLALRSPPTSAGLDSPIHHRRPSAASVREMHQARNSFSDYRTSSSAYGKVTGPPSTAASGSEHKKQPSFDRNWTMGVSSVHGGSPPRMGANDGLVSSPNGAVPPAKDYAPAVTKLDSPTNNNNGPISPTSTTETTNSGGKTSWLSAIKPSHKSTGSGGGGGGGASGAFRAISDSVSAPFAKLTSPATEQSPLASPLTRTGSSTPSNGHSFELDSPDANKSTAASTASGNSRGNVKRKNKQETSAYQRGLLKISPREAMKDADYSGWMKKKSSNLMTTWKPRFFILKGRRLSYYYSEDDEQEKGLIDISFHRVLPADNERLMGLHATLTGAGIPSSNSSEPVEKGDDTMFIFKLVPPRAGLSKAVNFTKPTVHYFAVPTLTSGRLWMAALMKATIERDDKKPVTTTYQATTISLAKARQQRQRPPELRDEKGESVAGPGAAAAAAAAAMAATEGVEGGPMSA